MSTHDASLLPGLPFGTPFPNATGGSGVKCGRAPDSTGFNFTWESLNCVDTYKVDSQIFTTCVQGLRRAWQAGVRARGGGGGAGPGRDGKLGRMQGGSACASVFAGGVRQCRTSERRASTLVPDAADVAGTAPGAAGGPAG
jgi:hypothetical protein